MALGPGSHLGEPSAAIIRDFEASLKKDVAARRRFIEAIVPVVQARVARVLARTRPANGVAARQELHDLMQEVFVALYEDDARVLRAWDAARGLSLLNFVGLIAERQTVSLLRSGKRSPFRDTPSELEELDRALEPEVQLEPSVISRDMLLQLVERLRESLSVRGLDLFYRLFVDSETVEEISADTGMSADAIYAWRSRLGKLIRVLAADLSAGAESVR